MCSVCGKTLLLFCTFAIVMWAKWRPKYERDDVMKRGNMEYGTRAMRRKCEGKYWWRLVYEIIVGNSSLTSFVKFYIKILIEKYSFEIHLWYWLTVVCIDIQNYC